ncbi:Bud site selection protein 14 [Spathaspora sp. JA1]|nr:Bud site selection protein 14 [Spathaspora sp. JA1]
MESESNPYTTANLIPAGADSRKDNIGTPLSSPDYDDNNSVDLVEHNNTLESTNKLLHDLEQKLTPFSPTASVSSSQYTQTGSVVHNPNLTGLGKSTITSSVLQYIINNEEDEDEEESASRRIHNNIFDPNELFNERNNKFMTKFGKGYNDDNLIHQQRKLIRKNSLRVNQDRLEKKISDSSLNGHISDSSSLIHVVDNIEDEDEEEEDVNQTREGNQNDHEELNETSTPDPNTEKFVNEEEHPEEHEEYEEENIDDLYLAPSPPRSPPREIDPNKLYGLYDFSGPDPSHCTLVRDEPVHLLNDEDNYWWLIRKLTKEERIARGLVEEEDQEIMSDEEDGKVGFVPAECLETYGERLARLNCFKNEELEKKEVSEEGDTSDDSLSPHQNKKCNKSVTFESLGEIKDDEDNEEEVEQETEAHRPPSFGYFIHDDEITKDNENPSEVKQQETLSDVYPETPLNIVKHQKKSNKKQPDNNAFSELFIQPKRSSLNTLDDISIGSFSPDTPPKREEPDEEDDENSSLTRSIILDRLRKVTSDIQEQIEQADTQEEEQEQEEEDHDLTYSENPYHRTAREYSSSPEYLQPESAQNHQDQETSQSSPENSSSHLSLHKSKKERESIDEATTSSFEDLSITPSTSVNSLNDIKSERRKSKPVHEMFIPILGKFDELAEKLAELDGILNKL